jgi:hypothetical protein
LDSLCAALIFLLFVAGVRESWSFSVGPVIDSVFLSSCSIKDGDVLGDGDVVASSLISGGEVSSSGGIGINSLALSGLFGVDVFLGC